MEFKIYKLQTTEPTQERMAFYGITKLKPNLCYNLLFSYYNNVDDKIPEKPYFRIFKCGNWTFDILETFDNRKDAKLKLKELIKNDTVSINKPRVEEPIKEPKIMAVEIKLKVKKPRKTEDPKYYKNYYLQNKERIQNYYNDKKERIITYQKNRYNTIKEKLKKLVELENLLK